jgi:hypothetical protein
LIHCLLKRKFFPLLGPALATKAFWLVTFVFVNPLLTLLYMIFGVAIKDKPKNARTVNAGRVICLVLAEWILQSIKLQ